MKYLAIIFLISTIHIFAQVNEAEIKLAGHLNRISYLKYNAPNDDSLFIENARFKKLLIEYLKENDLTITASFDTVVKAGLSIASSDDHMFRIYSWDTQTGGTMRFYNNVYQYKSRNKVFYQTDEDSTEPGDPRSWYSDIYTLDEGGKRYYLGLFNADYSTRDKAQGITFFSIEFLSLDTDVKLAKTSEGLSSGLGINYNFFSIPDNAEWPYRLVTYDKDKRAITMPIIDENGNLTKKSEVYSFKDGYFEKTK